MIEELLDPDYIIHTGQIGRLPTAVQTEWLSFHVGYCQSLGGLLCKENGLVYRLGVINLWVVC
jgi:hypothetical protein